MRKNSTLKLVEKQFEVMPETKPVTVTDIQLSGIENSDISFGAICDNYSEFGLCVGDMVVIVKNQIIKRGDLVLTNDGTLKRFELTVIGCENQIGIEGKVSHVIRQVN